MQLILEELTYKLQFEMYLAYLQGTTQCTLVINYDWGHLNTAELLEADLVLEVYFQNLWDVSCFFLFFFFLQTTDTKKQSNI